MFPQLFKKEVLDAHARENFKRISDFFSRDAVSNSEFRLLPLDLPLAAAYPVTGKFVHSLGFVPKDAIITYNSNNVSATIDWAKTDSTYIYITYSGVSKLRMLLGRNE